LVRGIASRRVPLGVCRAAQDLGVVDREVLYK
jgi:hypothetical protein